MTPKSDEPDDGSDRRDDLRRIPNISEQILYRGTQIHERSSLRQETGAPG